jgi:hypothetical protein
MPQFFLTFFWKCKMLKSDGGVDSMRSSRKEAPDSEQGSPVPAYSTPEVGVFFRDGLGIAPKVRSFSQRIWHD